MQATTRGEILVNLAHKEDFAEKVNALGTSRRALKADEIAVRTPRLIGTEQTVSGGKLRESDLHLFAELTVGAPLLIGHQKETKPIGRVYDAWVENQMVYAPFYIPLGRSDAKDLLIDIDTGVISEVSASFSFDKPMCAICDQDMRSLACGHVPGKDNAFYYYDTLKKVLEVSLVYRGGHPGTGFTNLALDPEWAPKFLRHGERIEGKEFLMQKQEDTKISNTTKTENLMVPGFISLLNRLLEDKIKGEYGMSRIQCITKMASYAEMAVSEVEMLLTSAVKVCPTVDQLRGFASALGCAASPLIREAMRDGCEYDVKMIQKKDGEVAYRSYM